MISLASKKILVTGATGFVGEHLCQRLHQSGAEIHTISRHPVSHNPLGLHWHTGDLTDSETVSTLVKQVRPNLVFHLASYVSGSRDLSAVLPTFHNNLTSTVNLLTAVTEVGCDRIVLAGSMEEPDSQDSAPVPCSPYAAAKWGSSAYAQLFHQLYQTPVVVARLFMIYGPAQKDLNKLIPYTIRAFLANEAPKFSSGHRKIDWIFIDDVIEGLLSLAQTPHIDGRAFDIGSGHLVSIRSVIDALVQNMSPSAKPTFGALPDRPMERERKANLPSDISWKPEVTLTEGLDKTVSWYSNNICK